MVESNLKHPTYKFVDEKEADAIAWAFIEKNKMQRVAIKFPDLKPDEVRAEITYVGLCHSDVHTVSEEWGPCPFPIVPGHEIVGRVIAVGSDVKDFKVGDKVGFGVQRDCCENCEYCKMTYDNLCNGKVEQKLTYGAKVWGGYCTLLQQPAKFYFKIPEGLPEEKVPPLFCAGTTTYSPIARYAKPGQKVAVLGIGGLGHLAVMYAKAWGCHVTGFTSSKDKEEFIKKLGADRVVVMSPETLKEEEGKYHLIINTLPIDTKMTELVRLTKPLGRFCQVGLPPRGHPGPFNVECLVHADRDFCGSFIGSRKEIKEMLGFSAKHHIVPICEQFEFKDFEKAYDHLVNGRPKFRCVVHVEGNGPKKQ